ncbi:hypothetical protein [Xylella fastidiosa]|uniref:hypothetical protein n=3 Tax=Xylella fastidiosa TaxID=2371 RepID=UPI000A57F2DC|nr:hypothetical protein [Xylella fastidiosa]UIT50809.1 hypothetical protein LZ752_04275 [Xylella fastidiosa subsp. fastidiosa]
MFVQCWSGKYKLLEACTTKTAADSLVDRLVVINAYAITRNLDERQLSISFPDRDVATALSVARDAARDEPSRSFSFHQEMLKDLSKKAFGPVIGGRCTTLGLEWSCAC